MIFIFLTLELFFRFERNSFKLKADFQKENISQIKNIVLGSSHSQNGINPKFFSEVTSNLSYGSQDIKTDSALFFRYFPSMKNLQNVFIEIDYHRFDLQNDPKYFRNGWYYIYHDIDMDNIPLASKYSLYLSDPSFFNNNIKQIVFKDYQKQYINEYGFVEKNYNNPFAKMNYDSLLIAKTSPDRLKDRHHEFNLKIRESNKRTLNTIINFCIKKKVNIFLYKSPMYFTYTLSEIPAKRELNKKYIDSLVTTNSSIKFKDFEQSTKFHLKDFSNEDHLNATGATKFTKLLQHWINHENH